MSHSVPTLPRISLVTPCFNAARTIERTIKSIEKQCYPHLQAICVDGGSTDDTVAIARRYPHVYGTVISERDHGAADAINKGFRCADGEIHCYLNADDEFTSGTLHRVAEEFLAHPDADVVTGGCHRFFADGSTYITQVPERFVRVMALRNDIEQPSTFWRAAIHRKAGELDESFRLAFDWEWWNRLKSCGATFRRIPDVLSNYYFTDDNLTSRGAERVVEEMYRITKKYGPAGGSIADVYRFLYKWFDLRGYYDVPIRTLPWGRRLVLLSTLRVLSAMFGHEAVGAYNWNWASKQVRGLVWYKY